MLKEYEMIYSKFKMHYDAVERTFRIYLIIIGAVLSLIGFFLEGNSKSFSLFQMKNFELTLLSIVSFTGVFIYFKIVEHRLLIIAYVKSLNLNRKWFEDNIEENISDYLYFKTGTEGAKFFARWRHFYWEAMTLSFLNSVFISIAVINGIIRLTKFQSAEHVLWNSACFAFLTTLFVTLQLTYYRLRGKKEEAKVTERFFH